MLYLPPKKIREKENVDNPNYPTYIVSVWIHGVFLHLHFFYFFSTRFLVFETNYTVHVLFMHCSRDPQPLYSGKNIKIGSHGTIYTFKNYFTTVFLVSAKISCIQTDS